MFSSNLFVMGLIAIGVIFIVCFFSYVRVPVNKIAFISGIGKNRVAKGKLLEQKKQIEETLEKLNYKIARYEVAVETGKLTWDKE